MADKAAPKDQSVPVPGQNLAGGAKQPAKPATAFTTMKAGGAKKPATAAGAGGTAANKPAAKVNPALEGNGPAVKKPPAGKPQVPHSEALAELEGRHEGAAVVLKRAVPAWGVSTAVHAVLIVILGLWVLPPQVKDKLREMVASVSEVQKEIEQVVDTPIPLDVSLVETAVPADAAAEALQSVVENITAEEPAQAQFNVELDPAALKTVPKNDLLSKIGAFDGAGQSLSGSRAEGSRMPTVLARGGNSQSEAAVARALKWLADHQAADGGWSFDHNQQKCNGRCKDCGTAVNARTAATALGVLPFLGAGQTHKTGQYKLQVHAALRWLIANEKVTKDGGDLRGNGGGNTGMYAHGLASIALCEAYAMTQDRDLVVPAQAAIGFIVNAQDPIGGGWRYSPRTPGDTSVVGWQLMALKSGHMGYLQVPMNCIKGAEKFLDTVQGDEGATYGYTESGKGSLAMTAVGLLCRMYTGWKREEPALIKGVERLAKAGPSKDNMYFNYYATQVLHQFEGDLWEKWNEKMRDQLIETQVKEGHETGSWHFAGGHSEPGGRLYNTSLSCMTLEVYYRHLPLYKKSSRDDDF